MVLLPLRQFRFTMKRRKSTDGSNAALAQSRCLGTWVMDARRDRPRSLAIAKPRLTDPFTPQFGRDVYHIMIQSLRRMQMLGLSGDGYADGGDGRSNTSS